MKQGGFKQYSNDLLSETEIPVHLEDYCKLSLFSFASLYSHVSCGGTLPSLFHNLTSKSTCKNDSFSLVVFKKVKRTSQTLPHLS